MNALDAFKRAFGLVSYDKVDGFKFKITAVDLITLYLVYYLGPNVEIIGKLIQSCV